MDRGIWAWMLLGWAIGLVVAIVIALSIVLLTQPGLKLAGLIGMSLGGFTSLLGLFVGGTYGIRRKYGR